jgi:Ca2+-binding EF-hand superfamily protein
MEVCYMSMLDDIKAKADEAGKVSMDQLNELKEKLPAEKFEELQKLADRNDDGKIDLGDLNSFDFGSLVDDAKKTLGGLFGK